MRALVAKCLLGSGVVAAALSAPARAVETDGAATAVCRVSLAQTETLKARRLDDTRYDVTVRQAGRSFRFELRFDCGDQPVAERRAQAGFERRADGWWLAAGSTPVRAEERKTPTWEGVAATGFHGNVCRSVAGKARKSDSTFFAEFCLPERDYRRASNVFDRVELQIVMPPGR